MKSLGDCPFAPFFNQLKSTRAVKAAYNKISTEQKESGAAAILRMVLNNY